MKTRKDARTPVTVAWLALTVLLPSRADAAEPTKKECIEANAQAQVRQRDGKLRAARELLQLCATKACPASVRDDCAERLDGLERRLPSLVFEAKDAAGGDVTAVRVQVDGELLAESLDGTALVVDPGEHVFTFVAAGEKAVTKKLVVREGDAARRERIVVSSAAPAPAPAAVVATVPHAGPSSTSATDPSHPAPGAERPSNAQRTTGIVVAVVGAVGVGVGAVLGGLASSRWSSSQEACAAPNSCVDYLQAKSDHDSASSLATGATVAFIAGGAALATGLVLYVTAPKGAPRVNGMRVVPALAGATFEGSFW